MTYYIEGAGEEELQEDYERYRDAVRRLNQIERELRRNGWSVEVGWASRDNLSAFHAEKGGRVRNVQIVRGEYRRRRRHSGYHTHPAHPYSHPVATRHRRK